MPMFLLEPYAGSVSRHICPQCGFKKVFTRYVNQDTGEHLADQVGRCNREDRCGYHYPPARYYQDHPLAAQGPVQHGASSALHRPLYQPPSFIPDMYFQGSLIHHSNNHLVTFLYGRFPAEEVNRAINNYHLGSSKHWAGSTVFWQVDYHGKVRAGKVMLYDQASGKRIKKPHHHITWVHSLLKLPGYHLEQCFFGEHLLKTAPFKVVGLVESEKTALIASLYFPDVLWLATGGLNNLTLAKCKVLKGRTVILYPDLNAFDKWAQKASCLQSVAKVKVSALLETNATIEERQRGLDLADYLLKSPYKKLLSVSVS